MSRCSLLNKQTPSIPMHSVASLFVCAQEFIRWKTGECLSAMKDDKSELWPAMVYRNKWRLTQLTCISYDLWLWASKLHCRCSILCMCLLLSISASCHTLDIDYVFENWCLVCRDGKMNLFSTELTLSLTSNARPLVVNHRTTIYAVLLRFE